MWEMWKKKQTNATKHLEYKGEIGHICDHTATFQSKSRTYFFTTKMMFGMTQDFFLSNVQLTWPPVTLVIEPRWRWESWWKRARAQDWLRAQDSVGEPWDNHLQGSNAAASRKNVEWCL
jgi:hypothetical protein